MTAEAHPPSPLDGAIPAGTFAIEASAGTGKTYALSALVARHLAETDTTTGSVLVVTYTRAAANELRSRVRNQLIDLGRYLVADEPETTASPWMADLRADDPDERSRRCDRVAQAVTDFDAMTVATIHSFAHQVLTSIGTAAGADPDATMGDDEDRLLVESCADVLAAAATSVPANLLPKLTTLVDATTTAGGSPGTVLMPRRSDLGDDPAFQDQLASAVLADLIEQSLSTMAERRARRNSFGFSDVLLRLRDALTGPAAGASLEVVRKRFSVVLIDEFQDTDPVQWEIFSALFDSSDWGGRLVLVGDPKQSIYGFRGADINTYVNATTERPGLTRSTLTVNWRSDGALLQALNELYRGVTFFDAGRAGQQNVGYTEVTAANKHADTRLRTVRNDALAPLVLRVASGDIPVASDPNLYTVEQASSAILGDLAEEAFHLLTTAVIPGTGESGTESTASDGSETTTDDDIPAGHRRVRPSDITVLVRTRFDGYDVMDALRERGIPAVMASGDTVLSTPAADQWRILLHAIGEPTSSRWARAFALSWFGGETAATVAELDDDAIAIIQNRLASWAETLLTHGIGAFLAVVWTQSAIAPRVLERFDGDRSITDLEHVAELLRSASPHDRSSVAGLLASLDTETAPKSAEKEDDVAARRVESDDEAVQVMTIFKAKGLEFPIVLVPIMWKTPYKAKKKAIDVTYTDPATGNRIYDLTGGMGWPDDETAQNRRELAEAEALGQQQRLLYVALTRAKHRTVVWWASVDNGGDSALAHLLFARDDEGGIDHGTFAARTVTVPSNDKICASLDALVSRSAGTIEVCTHGMAAPGAMWSPNQPKGSSGSLAVAALDRRLDRSRHRWSFTALTRRFEEASIDPLDPSLGDRGAYDEPPDADGEDEAAASVPVVSTSSALTALPAGTEFGTLVHSVLERVDFTADDLQDAVGLALAEVDHTGAGIPMTDGNGDRVDGSPLLTTGLAQAISTPLGSLLGDVSLRQFGPDRRLNELAFELPLRTRGHAATVAGIGRLITDHLGPDDVLARWASALRDGAFDVDLAGHLTGSIDLVLRLDDGRFVVADYKSNRLVPAGTVPPPDAYGRDALAGAMAEHHYPLQALLYEVALHRYLRWRLGPAYSPGDHLGGSAYLFVRGMAGPDTPSVDGHRDGVFDWAVPADLIVELSDLLDGTSTKAKTA